MALLHRSGLVGVSPFPWISGDLDADGHTEPCELVQAPHADGGLSLLVGEGSGSQGGADDGLVAIHAGLGQ